jgi:hypothetical protein
MSLRGIYSMAETAGKCLLDVAGYEKGWFRASLTTDRNKPRILDALPVDIRRQGLGWVVVFDFDSIGGTGWSEFDAKIRSLAMAKLAALPNMRQFARDNGVQYSGLWRAKSGTGRATDRIVDMVGACPDGSVEWPGGATLEQGGILPHLEPLNEAAWRYLKDNEGVAGTLTRRQFNTLVRNLAEQSGGQD